MIHDAYSIEQKARDRHRNKNILNQEAQEGMR
jgi:hypothetical protein